jgi:hypothetical protein
MRNRCVLSALLLLLGSAVLAVPVRADDVYLKNGRTFEGVIADVGDTQVRVRLQGGIVSLPKSAVLRVEKSDSSLGEFLHRRDALRHAGAAARAADWLDLARYAKSAGLEQAARETALTAAELDPHLPGLGPLLRPLGFVFEAQIDRWIPYEDSMRRHGMVLDNGEWVTREEHAERARVRDEERARREQALWAQQAAQAARDAELLRAQIELYRATAPSTDYSYGYGSPYYYSFAPGFVVPGFRHDRQDRDTRREHEGLHRESREDEMTRHRSQQSLIHHQPGSLLPGLAP